MNKVLTVLAAVVLAVSWLAPAARADAAATYPGELRVEDNAGAFTPDGIKQAEDSFHGTTFKSPTHLTVVTVREVPEHRKQDFDAVAKNPERRGQFFEAWAREMAQERREKGIFVLMFVDERRYIVRAVTDKASDVYRSFTDEAARTLVDRLSAGCERALGKPAEQARAERDAALLDATNYVAARLKETAAPQAGETTWAAADDHGRRGGGTDIMGWICIGLAVLLGVWLVIGLIRAFSGAGGGAGGGGGGFFPSLLGGLFGVMAGMWLYNSFFGGESSAMASDATSGDAGAGDTGEGNFDDGASAGSEGGDWGDAGGGDWGDFGGGDFGGGDW
jgi:hypothetical protein